MLNQFVVLIKVAGLKLLASFQYANFLTRAGHTRGSNATAITRADHDDLVVTL
jgi:hypothetical protein